jgi:hypothetical protein
MGLAGTNANVFITLFGPAGATDELMLDTQRDHFEKIALMSSALTRRMTLATCRGFEFAMTTLFRPQGGSCRAFEYITKTLTKSGLSRVRGGLPLMKTMAGSTVCSTEHSLQLVATY